MLTLLIPYYPYNNDTSDYLICYDRGQIGKTRDYVALAQKLEKLRIENIAQEHKMCYDIKNFGKELDEL